MFQKVHVKDVLVDIGCPYRRSTLLTKSSYIALFFQVFSQSLWKTKWKRLATTDWSVRCLLVLFEIQLKGGNYYESVKISRINLEK